MVEQAAEQIVSQSEIELSPPVYPLGPGSVLKQAREACGLGVDDIAQQLRISVQRIIEIEENNFSEIKVVAYAQGYLRAYAELVKLPIESVLASFKNLEWVCQENVATQQDKSDQWVKQFLPLGKASSRLWFYIGGIVLAVIVVGLVIDYWPEHESVKAPIPVTAAGGPTLQALSTLAPQSVNNSATAKISVLSAQPETEAENPFVQPLTSKSPSKKVPIIEAQPVSPQKVEQ